MLGDFSYDGIPYLYVYSSDISKNNDLQSFEIYGWKNDIAELVCDTHSSGSSIAWETYDLYEDENDQIKLLFNTEFGVGERCIIYSFSEGAMDESYVQEGLSQDTDSWVIKENGIETGVYPLEESYKYSVLKDVQEFRENHTHTQPYTCFYDMQSCTLEEMVNYLNAYASVMSDGQSVPVEIIEAVEESTESGTNNNLLYSIDGNDIIYNGVTYTDLYANIKTIELESQYDADMLIKIVLEYYPSMDTVFTMCNVTPENGEIEIPEGADYNDISIDEEFESSELYRNLRDEYNDSAKWKLAIYKYGGIDNTYLIGCKSFTLIIGTDGETEISDFQ